jgi:hypothetical protein
VPERKPCSGTILDFGLRILDSKKAISVRLIFSVKIDDFVKSRHPVEKRGPGVCNFLGTLDSGFRRNDEKNAFSTFYETIKIEKPYLRFSFRH